MKRNIVELDYYDCTFSEPTDPSSPKIIRVHKLDEVDYADLLYSLVPADNRIYLNGIYGKVEDYKVNINNDWKTYELTLYISTSKF